jgi:glucosamine--fructose-6-phosphate aminotransferase (isomerizing)
MCGIIGYVGYRRCQDILFDGLRSLEYRGYDSAGMAWSEGGRIVCVRAVGNLDSLGEALKGRSTKNGHACKTTVGIGHTRWATHGGVSERNAHPHADASGRIRIVVNGIIENHVDLRRQLADQAVRCVSDTDAEVVAHLVAMNYAGDLAQAVRASLPELSGHYALVAMCEDEPGVLVGVRRDCPLVAGVGEGEQFIASSITAFRQHTRRGLVLGDGEVAVLRSEGISVLDARGAPRRPAASKVDWDEDRCDKGGFDTFMLKEIHEQPRACAETLAHWRAHATSGADEVLSDSYLSHLSRIVILGCGTSYHAGLAGAMAIERWARIPVDVEVASEFRYRDPILPAETLVIGITQSGETADTLAAMRLARERGAKVVALTNVTGSQATRESDAVLLTRAGTEVGVAATKTFVAQVVLLYALALQLAKAHKRLPASTLSELHTGLNLLPAQIDAVLSSVDARVRALAERLAPSQFFLYLGRLSGLPVAMEGGLKLKEIAYIPTDAYPAGEMKHGPIALLSKESPVICVATEERVLPKLLSNISEVRARGARVLAITSEGCKELGEHAEEVFYVPRTDALFQVVLAAVPLQLLAYYIARARGLNVDQPRNLAKTVTVE